jgi:hypothetical protein
MRQTLSLTVVVALPLLAGPPQGAAAPLKPAPEGPVIARLVAQKTTYQLDLNGKTPADYRKELKEGEESGKLPPCPAVELSLELMNVSGHEVQVWISGTPVQVQLDLKGPGALNLKPRIAFPRIFILPKPVTLKPGEKHVLPLPSLAHGFRGQAERAFWTEPGEYSLGATFQTAINPAPKDVPPDPQGFGRVSLVAEPIKLKVEGK